jgi:hypothetical protein
MRKVLLLGLLVSMLINPSATQSEQMKSAEFQIFLHDLDRDLVRWRSVVSEVDVSSLKSLPYNKGRLMETGKSTLRKYLSAIQKDVSGLRTQVTLAQQIDLLVDLEEAQGEMAALATYLDIENPADMDEYSTWLSDVSKAFGEILNASVKFYGHLRQLSLSIDRQIDVGKVR